MTTTISQGRLNAEALNALGSKGEWVEFYTIVSRVQTSLPSADSAAIYRTLVALMRNVRPDSDIWTETEPGNGWRKVVRPEPRPEAVEHFENAVLDLLRALLGIGEHGGPALVRLAGDLDAMTRTATFPHLTATMVPDPDSDPDEFGNAPTIVRIGCPVCGADDVSAPSIYAVDSAQRWTEVSDFEAALDPAPGQSIGFANVSYGNSADFEGVGYYLHDTGKPHPVSLPEGWTEVAL